ncbi:MAG: hypothetical protein WA939_08090 [Nodosilinea sp.]
MPTTPRGGMENGRSATPVDLLLRSVSHTPPLPAPRDLATLPYEPAILPRPPTPEEAKQGGGRWAAPASQAVAALARRRRCAAAPWPSVR